MQTPSEQLEMHRKQKQSLGVQEQSVLVAREKPSKVLARKYMIIMGVLSIALGFVAGVVQYTVWVPIFFLPYYALSFAFLKSDLGYRVYSHVGGVLFMLATLYLIRDVITYEGQSLGLIAVIFFFLPYFLTFSVVSALVAILMNRKR